MTVKVECSQCHKRVKNLKLHFRNSHPDLLKDAFGESAKSQTETQEQPQQPDVLEKLRVFGIEPEQVMAILSPLVETAVVKTLEKMQLGKVINKKMVKRETRLKTTPESTQSGASQSSAQPASGSNTDPYAPLKEKVLNALVQKFIGGDSGGAGSLAKQLEQLTGLMDFTRKIADTYYSPIQEVEMRVQKRLIGQLELYRKAGASPDKATEMTINQNK